MLRRNAILLGIGMVWAASLAVAGTASAAQPPAYSCPAAMRACGGAAAAHIGKRSKSSAHCGRHAGRSLTTRRHGKCETASGHRRKRTFRSGEHVVSQIPSRSSRTGSYALLCKGKATRHAACRTVRPTPIGLPDALLVPPNPRTERALKDEGIPAIADVPPIFILRPERAHDGKPDWMGAH